MNRLVICFSTASLNAEIWTNKQHLMTRLSEVEGYKVIFVDQGMSKSEILREIKRLNLNYFVKPVTKISENLISISPYFLPLLRGGALKQRSWKWLWSIFLKRYIKPDYDEVIIWTYQPQSWYLIKLLKKRNMPFKFLYDCVDDFKSQPSYENYKKRKNELIEVEDNLVQNMDLIVTTSEKLYEDKRKINRNSYYVHNVGDFDHFNRAGNTLPENAEFLSNIKKQKVAYAGVIDDYKIDLKLILQAAQFFKQKIFILIGPVRISGEQKYITRLRLLSNVHFLGLVQYQLLPAVLHECDIIWLPYNNNQHTRYVFPLKLFEAFATGKKVIAKSLPSYQMLHHLMITFDGFEDLQKVFDREDMYINERIEVARRNSWESRLNKILNLLDK